MYSPVDTGWSVFLQESTVTIKTGLSGAACDCLWGNPLLRPEQSVPQRKFHELGTMSQTQLLHHPRAVGLHCLGREEELFADLARAEPFCCGLQYLQLPFAEAFQ